MKNLDLSLFNAEQIKQNQFDQEDGLEDGCSNDPSLDQKEMSVFEMMHPHLDSIGR